MLPIMLGILTAIFILILCALLFMDSIMRAAAPDLYLLGRASRTYNTLTAEMADTKSRQSFLNLLRDHHGMDFSGEINGINAQLSEEYDKGVPLSYITGSIMGVDLELLLQNDTSSVCIPSVSDRRYTIPSETFGAVLNASPLKPFMPVTLSDKASIMLPERINQIDTYGIYAALEDMLHAAHIGKHSEKTDRYLKYNLYINGADLKQALIKMCPSVFGEDSELNELCTAMLENAVFPENTVMEVGERDRRLVYFSTAPYISDEQFKLTLDLSGATAMLNDIKFELSYAGFGVKLNSNGAHTRSNEAYSDQSELSITTPFTDNIFISSYVHPLDKNNFASRIKLQSDLGSAVIETRGSINGDSIHYDISDFKLFDKYTATGTLVITSKHPTDDPIMIKERPEKPLSEVKSLRDLL